MDQDLQRSSLRVLPVIDLRGGRPVHATGGSREAYGALKSLLYCGDDPLGLPRAFRDVLGTHEFYLADLDAIEGRGLEIEFLRRVHAEGLKTWIDAGLHGPADLEPLIEAGATTVIASTETLGGPAQLAGIFARAGVESLVFGLDLREGRPVLAIGSRWPSETPLGLIHRAIEIGIRRILILDIARVGSGRGVGTIPLVMDLIRRAPEIEVIVGGGIQGRDDLKALADLGVSTALVGSALHDGRIGAADLREIGQPTPIDRQRDDAFAQTGE